jgi:hypothetical protein
MFVNPGGGDDRIEVWNWLGQKMKCYLKNKLKTEGLGCESSGRELA